MHIFWFLLMVGSFMSIMFKNVKLALDPDYIKKMNGKGVALTMVAHFINYVILYFALTNFIGHMVARF